MFLCFGFNFLLKTEWFGTPSYLQSNPIHSHQSSLLPTLHPPYPPLPFWYRSWVVQIIQSGTMLHVNTNYCLETFFFSHVFFTPTIIPHHLFFYPTFFTVTFFSPHFFNLIFSLPFLTPSFYYFIFLWAPFFLHTNIFLPHSFLILLFFTPFFLPPCFFHQFYFTHSFFTHTFYPHIFILSTFFQKVRNVDDFPICRKVFTFYKCFNLSYFIRKKYIISIQSRNRNTYKPV